METTSAGWVFLDGMLEELGSVRAAMIEDRRWNGWAMPWFTREEAARIAAASNALVAEWGTDAASAFAWDGDRLIESREGEESWEVPTVERSGVTLYGVGAGSWCWSNGHPDGYRVEGWSGGEWPEVEVDCDTWPEAIERMHAVARQLHAAGRDPEACDVYVHRGIGLGLVAGCIFDADGGIDYLDTTDILYGPEAPRRTFRYGG